MNFYEKARILIVYGGIDDQRTVKGHPAFYTHLGVLDLTKLTWLTVQVHGDFQEPRCSHSAAFCGTKFIIFGGINATGFVKPIISYFEVNQTTVIDLTEQFNRRAPYQQKRAIAKKSINKFQNQLIKKEYARSESWRKCVKLALKLLGPFIVNFIVQEKLRYKKTVRFKERNDQKIVQLMARFRKTTKNVLTMNKISRIGKAYRSNNKKFQKFNCQRRAIKKQKSINYNIKLNKVLSKINSFRNISKKKGKSNPDFLEYHEFRVFLQELK